MICLSSSSEASVRIKAVAAVPSSFANKQSIDGIVLVGKAPSKTRKLLATAVNDGSWIERCIPCNKTSSAASSSKEGSCIVPSRFFHTFRTSINDTDTVGGITNRQVPAGNSRVATMPRPRSSSSRTISNASEATHGWSRRGGDAGDDGDDEDEPKYSEERLVGSFIVVCISLLLLLLCHGLGSLVGSLVLSWAYAHTHTHPAEGVTIISSAIFIVGANGQVPVRIRS
jgi:hypothetical protein